MTAGTHDPREVVRRFFEDAPSGALDDELIAEDLVYHGPAMLGEMRGREAFKGLMIGFRTGFPGFETELGRMIVEGDLVAVWHTHTGRHLGEFAGLPASGRPIRVDGLELLRVRDGQVVEFWHMDDFLGLMQQIGGAPADAGA